MSEGTPQTDLATTEYVEDVLLAWIARASPVMPRDRAVVMARRLGWCGEAEITLEAAGDLIGVTRERIRQIQKKLEERLARTRPPSLAFLHEAAIAIATSSDRMSSPGEVLHGAGLARSSLPSIGIHRALALAHLSHVAEWERVMREIDERQSGVSGIIREARRLAGAVGVVSVDWLTHPQPSVEDPSGTIRRALEAAGLFRFLDDSWFWSPAIPRGRNRLRNLIRKMTAACGPLTATDIAGGLDRQRRQGRMPRVPSEGAILLFAAAHPEFVVDHAGLVNSQQILNPIEELDTTEETLYLILTEAEDGFMDRREFQEQAIAQGLNANTFSVYTSYSPILDNPAPDRWSLRGKRISPAVLAAYGSSRRQRRYVRSEWLADGTLRIDRELHTVHSAVISIPSALVRYVAGRDFMAFDADGGSLGAIRFNDNGGSWGYSRFIEQRGVGAGEVVRLDLNLAAGTVRLSRTQPIGELG